MQSNEIALVSQYNSEINVQLADAGVKRAMLATVFKGFEEIQMKQAVLEGMMRGYSFKDFLTRKIHAIKYGDKYNLVTTIEDARSRGARGGVCGKEKAIYTMDEKKIVACEVTVLKRVGEYVGRYTAEVFFEEYYAGHKNADGSVKKTSWGEAKANLWDTKPRTMIAKVAEMHALRMACPEDIGQIYIDEELDKGDENRIQARFEAVAGDSSALSLGKLTQPNHAKEKEGEENQDQGDSTTGTQVID